MIELTIFERVLILITILFSTIIFFKFILNPIQRGLKKYSWNRRISVAILLEICSIFIIQTFLFADKSDWNGWFAIKANLINIKIIDVLLLESWIILLLFFSIVGFILGIKVISYPLIKQFITVIPPPDQEILVIPCNKDKR